MSWTSKGQGIEPVLLALNTEKDMMVDIGVAAVQAIERADQIVGASGIDLIRHQKAERVAVPGDHPGQVGRHQHAVADMLDLGCAAGRSLELAVAQPVRSQVEGLARHWQSPYR